MFDLIARYIPLIEKIKLKSRKGLMIATLTRFLFIPCFYFTAKYGDQGWMIMLVSFLGLTNGYLTVCVLTVAPQGYKVGEILPYISTKFEKLETFSFFGTYWILFQQGPEQNALGNLLVLCLLAGLFSGVALDWLWIIGNGKF